MATIIDNIPPDQLAVLVSVFAITISDGLTADENGALGSFIAAIGDTIVMIGSQQLLLEANKSKTVQ